MSKSQSIGRVKQKPNNNCQTNTIITKTFVQFFSAHQLETILSLEYTQLYKISTFRKEIHVANYHSYYYYFEINKKMYEIPTIYIVYNFIYIYIYHKFSYTQLCYLSCSSIFSYRHPFYDSHIMSSMLVLTLRCLLTKL